MTVRRVLLPHLALLLGAGCMSLEPIEISSDHDPKASFQGLKTYAWMARPASAPDGEEIYTPELKSSVERAVVRELKRRGFTQTSSNPDFLVGWYAVVNAAVETSSVGSYYGYAEGAGWDARYSSGGRQYVSGGVKLRRYHYEQGSLILDVVDPKTKRPIWRGTASAEVFPNWSAGKRRARIDTAVGMLLKDFPPKKKQGGK